MSSITILFTATTVVASASSLPFATSVAACESVATEDTGCKVITGCSYRQIMVAVIEFAAVSFVVDVVGTMPIAVHYSVGLHTD